MGQSAIYNRLVVLAIIGGMLLIAQSGCKSLPEEFKEPELPILTTLETTGISGTSAVSGGKVYSTGSAPLTARGVCWNMEGNPTINDYRTLDGTGMGAFTSIISGLNEGTAYVVRAYAINSVGIAYGNQELFTTVTLPVIKTADVKEITSGSARCGGEVVFCGGASVTSRGVCWNTTGHPTINDAVTSDGKGIGSFISLLTELSENSVYYVRAFATNSVGTAYGKEIDFKTSE